MKPDHGQIEAARHGIARSSKWPAVEKAHLALEPYCVCCGPESQGKVGVQVHHKFPFHYCIALGRPDLELDQRNLISLCEDEHGKPSQNHHLEIGHLQDFKSSNISVASDVVKYSKMTKDSIMSNQDWQTEKSNRLKPLDEMTDEDKKQFTDLMNATFPLVK